MECPTCFQKITVPQAPSGEQKFVLTGTKKSERPIPIVTETTTLPPRKTQGIPGTIIVVIILIFIGAVVGFVYRGTIFKSQKANAPAMAASSNAVKKIVETNAPPASDGNWMLDLSNATTPDSQAAGRIHGQNFVCEHSAFQNGTLTIRAGTRGPTEFGLTINFQGAAARALSGQTINVTTNAPQAARVTLRWIENGRDQRESFTDSYAMRLEFGPEMNSRIPAKIYLCLPDIQKSYLAGIFTVEVRKSRTK